MDTFLSGSRTGKRGAGSEQRRQPDHPSPHRAGRPRPRSFPPPEVVRVTLVPSFALSGSSSVVGSSLGRSDHFMGSVVANPHCPDRVWSAWTRTCSTSSLPASVLG